MTKTLLSVKDLAVEFATYGGSVKALRGVSFDLMQGEVLAIVGESGSGKSVTCQTLMGLIPMPPGRIVGGTTELNLEGQKVDLLHSEKSAIQNIRGRDISMIFQDPLTSLNPTMTIGNQIAEVLVKHRGMSWSQGRREAIDMMKLVQIPNAADRVNAYPHQFSGGMRQRIMIAIALACRPKILIADEPTTALDVTIQGQILDLLKNLQREINMSIILITHDLGVVAQMADRVAVMYAGEIVEAGSVDDVFARPGHPYNLGLQRAIPNPLDAESSDLLPIPGSPPDLFSPPRGCAFNARCPHAMKVCGEFSPPRFDFGRSRYASCWLHHQKAPSHLRQLVNHDATHA